MGTCKRKFSALLPWLPIIALCIAVLAGHKALAQTVPVNFSGSGVTSFDGWVNMNSATFTGFGSFPGSSPWLNPDKTVKTAGSNAANSGDAEIVRISGGEDGGPIFLSESLYFGSFVQVANALGGILRVSEPTPVSGVKTITLQVQIGEAIGYGFVQPNGAPLLKINGGTTTHAPTYTKVVNIYQNGVYDSPETGEEPVYVKTWAYQWNVGNLGAISSIQIDFSSVTHAQIYAMRLDQTSVLQSSNVFDAASPTPAMNLSGSGLAFGNVVVGSSKTGTLTISNTGNANLNVNSISYPSAAFAGSLSGTIPAGGSQNVTVTFAPTAATTSSGDITVSSNDAVSPKTIAISGTGLAPAIKQSLSGTPQFNGSVTTVTHNFESTPATWLDVEFTDNLTDPNSWTPHTEQVYSGSGQFPLTLTKPGDHRASWQRGMFFRLIYQTKP